MQKDSRARRHFKLIAKFAVTFGLLFLVLRAVGWDNLRTALAAGQWLWLIPMYLIMQLAAVLEALQMKILLTKVGRPVGLLRVYMANALSALYALVLPGDVLASAAKWADLSAATGDKAMVLSAIAYNRVALIIPPLLFGALSLALENPFDSYQVLLLLLLFIAAVLVGWLFLFHPKFGTLTDAMVRKIAGLLPASIAQKLQSLLDSLAAFRALTLAQHGTIYAISFLGMLIRVIGFGFAGAVFGVHLPFTSLIWLWAVLVALRQLPITISNLGVQEVVLIFLLSSYQVAPELAVGMSMTLFGGHIMMALIGLGYQISIGAGWVTWRTAPGSRESS